MSRMMFELGMSNVLCISDVLELGSLDIGNDLFGTFDFGSFIIG